MFYPIWIKLPENEKVNISKFFLLLGFQVFGQKRASWNVKKIPPCVTKFTATCLKSVF